MRLHCRIKKQYLDMITRGSKTTEYRDMSEYWCGKILDLEHYGKVELIDLIDDLVEGRKELKTKPYDEIQFYCGEQRPVYHIKDIKIYKGHKIFAIKLGKRIRA